MVVYYIMQVAENRNNKNKEYLKTGDLLSLSNNEL